MAVRCLQGNVAMFSAVIFFSSLNPRSIDSCGLSPALSENSSNHTGTSASQARSRSAVRSEPIAIVMGYEGMWFFELVRRQSGDRGIGRTRFGFFRTPQFALERPDRSRPRDT